MAPHTTRPGRRGQPLPVDPERPGRGCHPDAAEPTSNAQTPMSTTTIPHHHPFGIPWGRFRERLRLAYLRARESLGRSDLLEERDAARRRQALEERAAELRRRAGPPTISSSPYRDTARDHEVQRWAWSLVAEYRLTDGTARFVLARVNAWGHCGPRLTEIEIAAILAHVRVARR